MKMNSKQRILANLKKMHVNYADELKAVMVSNKDPDRVHKSHQKYPSDWKAQYNMLLNDGKTCKDCYHCDRCVKMFDQRESATSCQFYPSRVWYKQ